MGKNYLLWKDLGFSDWLIPSKCFLGVNLLAKLKHICPNILFYPLVVLNQIYFKGKLIHLFLTSLYDTNTIAILKNYLIAMESFEQLFNEKVKKTLEPRIDSK